MWIVQLALRRPYTFIVMALIIVLLTPLVILRTPVDIFPDINIPVISIVWNYNGMAPQEMADRIVSNSERGITTTVNDIEHLESTSLSGVAVIKVFFRPGTNIQTALSQVTAISQTALRQLPPGTTPPLVITYTASTIPIIQLGLSSKTLPEQQLFDLGNNFLRTQLATVQGAAMPFPYGGKQRQIMVDIDTAKLQQYALTPNDIVNAVNVQNLITPSGSAKIGSIEYAVEMNSTPGTIAELNNLPVRTVNGSTLYLRDIAHVRDGFAPQTNIVRQDGTRGALMSVLKIGRASTLDIVKAVKGVVPVAAQSLPPELKISSLFDQSLFVRASISGVIREGIIAAILTAAMILIFLGDWRPTVVIAVSIPLSIFVSIILLGAIGETINIMTLGGLALAVGILVDDATVTIENIERNIMMGKPMEQAILDGASQIAVPAFVSTICICIVFVPMFFLAGVAHFLFVPMAEAVVFAMLASYLLSRTLVPTLVMYIMRGHEHKAAEPKTFFGRWQRGFERWFENFRRSYESLLETTLEHRGAFVIAFAAFCFLSLGLVFFLGQDFFPQVDAGLLRIHIRARSGLRVEETARLTDGVENVMRQEIPANEIKTILDNIGVPYSGLNLSYSNSGVIGSSDAEIQVALDPEHHHPTQGYIDKLRRDLPAKFPGVEFFFQPADIVSQILNFGLPAPIDIQVTGANVDQNYVIAQQIANRLRAIPGTADVHVQQMLDLPTLHMDIDRSKATQVGMSARDVAQSVLVSLSGSFQTAPNFWLNPKNGVTYNIGGVATDVENALKPFEAHLPRGSHIVIRGQVETMKSSFLGLGFGLLMAVVLIYLLIVVNFQSWLDPFIIITALPAALAGICWFLLLTHTRLSVPALTGAVMCMGVATANSILMISFARDQLDSGMPAFNAAVSAGYTRIRPVLMTALAMVIGMIPMALGFGEGGEQNAPLGRTVIGGLIFATIATLFFVPAVFAIFHGRRESKNTPIES